METYFVDNMTETVLKAQVSQWWETETMEVESGSHQSQAILFLSTLYFDKSTYMSLLSYLWHYNRYFAFTHNSRAHPTEP